MIITYKLDLSHNLKPISDQHCLVLTVLMKWKVLDFQVKFRNYLWQGSF